MVTIPSNTPPGNYYLGLIYDNATDGNTSNNDTDGWDAVAITVTKADLDITALSAPASAQPGDSIDVVEHRAEHRQRGRGQPSAWASTTPSTAPARPATRS